ncbi:MAG: SirB2 family protein [Gammaproteobacteria bacterium]|nr:SirB2 family protein [Gammaproteobacteria bacterium]
MLVKYIHVSSVVLTLIFFIIRGIWMIMDMELLKKKWVKILAPIIDSVLLVSAILLAIETHQYPFSDHWLTAKVLALIAYIALGMVALNYGKTKNIRITAWLASLLCFAYIASVAISRNPVIFH